MFLSISDKGRNWARSNTNDWNGYFYYNAIDPAYIITPSREHWPIFGSWHSGFAALQLSADTGNPIAKMPEFCTTLAELNKVMNKDGWPVVMPERYGAVPQVAITEADIVGTWEHIDLSYSYGKQKTSSEMVFAADQTITSGTWKGSKWSFDATTNTLTANGVELLLQRECDWEASPRKHTIVYAGINNTKTYWGKKK